MITAEDVIKKLSQKKQRKQFLHKVKYGRELPEQWGYDLKSHREEMQRKSTGELIEDYFKNRL